MSVPARRPDERGAPDLAQAPEPPHEAAWRRLTPEARRALLEPLRRARSRSPLTPGTLAAPEALAEPFARELATAGFLVRVRSSAGVHFALDPAALPFLETLLEPARAAGPPEPPLEPLAPVTGGFERPIFQGDLAAVLLELARQPVKVKKTSELFEKSRARLEAALEPLPGWVLAIGFLALARRLDHALRTARALELVRDREGELALTAAGRELLARPRHERLVVFPAPAGRHDEVFFGVPATAVALADARDRATSRPPTDADGTALREAVARAFAPLEPGRPYALDAFTRAACAAEKAPLRRGRTPELVLATLGLRVIPPREDELEQASRQLLAHLVAGPLVHVGGVALAPTGAGFAFTLTALGRVYLGLDGGLAPEAAALGAEAIVQPNFDVVLLGAAPGHVAELLAFAEPTGGGPDDPARTLRITRARIQAAAGAGLGAEVVLERLGRLSRTGVPANVARAIRDWSGAVRRASLARAVVLELPDDETLERVQAALGAHARALGRSVAIEGLKPAELRRRLEKLGVALE